AALGAAAEDEAAATQSCEFLEHLPRRLSDFFLRVRPLLAGLLRLPLVGLRVGHGTTSAGKGTGGGEATRLMLSGGRPESREGPRRAALSLPRQTRRLAREPVLRPSPRPGTVGSWGH